MATQSGPPLSEYYVVSKVLRVLIITDHDHPRLENVRIVFRNFYRKQQRKDLHF